jgi:hypothetical protein
MKMDNIYNNVVNNENNGLEKGIFCGSNAYGFTWGLVLLKDLPKIHQHRSAFSCPNQNNEKWTIFTTT